MTDQFQSQFRASGVAQVMVMLKAGNSLATAAAGMPQDVEAQFTLTETSRNRRLKHAFGGGLAAGRAPRMVAKTGFLPAGAEPPKVLHFPRLGVALGTVQEAGLGRLQRHPMVAEVVAVPEIRLIKPIRRSPVPDELATSTRAGASPKKAELAWGLKALGVDKVWAQGFTGKGVRVGHLDTGVDGNHKAFAGKALAAFELFDAYGQRTEPRKAIDTDDHGTHTAATLVGRPVGARHFGVAPEAELYSAAVIEGGNALARVLGGMEWALEKKVRILSMSLGFHGWWDDFKGIISTLDKQGVLCVFAIGNEGPGESRSPGNYPGALSVGAMDEKKRIAPFSSSQLFVDGRVAPLIVAPGVDILSARPGHRLQVMDGTSMATPHVAGVAALLAHAAPTATNDELCEAIIASCAPLSHGKGDRYVHGAPNAALALKHLKITGTPSKSVFPVVGPPPGTARRRAQPAARRGPKKKGAPPRPRPSRSKKIKKRKGKKGRHR
ncbi:MAG: S8 family serine peptidase [Deltaproteobacteria bacterium]|nr:S8 family serine peptidase [Deltaproteobacteria bacterium]